MRAGILLCSEGGRTDVLDALIGFAVVGVAIAIGYVVGRGDLLGPHARFVLSRLVFFVLAPILLFVVLAGADVPTLFSALLPVSALAAAVILALYVLIGVLFFRRSVGETVIGALSAAQVNSNNIGIPISAYLLGNAAFSAPVILFQLLVLMPVALAILDVSTSGSRSFRRIMRQTARNPLLIGSALGALVAVSGIELPAVVLDPLAFVADACVPIMLISFGISLHGQRVLTSSGRIPDILTATVLKLFAMPLVAFLLALAFDLSREQTLIVVVLAALPTAQNVFNFSQRYDVGEPISRDTILLTTIGCVPVLLGATLLLG
jgi:malonate transporter and related proteins